MVFAALPADIPWTLPTVRKIGRALGTVLKETSSLVRVVVGQDTRESSPWIVPEIRIISSPDDFFAITLMTIFFAIGFGAMWLWIQGSPETGFMWIFFLMTTFFLLYVPFSKISHYVLYPFGRVMFGQIFGGRGVLNRHAR